MDAENKPLAATEKPVQPEPGDAEAAPTPGNTAATDEVFDRSLVLDAVSDGAEAAATAEPAEADASEQAPPPMLHPDYVRELQQEFEVQEDEGKL